MGSTQERKTVVIEGKQVDLTSLNKPLWPLKQINKARYLQYLHAVANYILPFLRERALTVIRYPHGIGAESFYQKNCPDYAPTFVRTTREDDINYIVCSDLPTLIWLGNQLAFEFHIPFNTIHAPQPAEIVIDLDPPDRDHFHLAIEAVLMLKEILDSLQLTSFVKTSGNKGLQIYIPLPKQSFSYDETRLFTKFVADYLVEQEPKWFTTQRLKKNRGQRLYVDFLQHASGKTIVAPYSVRGNDDALVATPLSWAEIKRHLRPERFSLEDVQIRLTEQGCPWADYWQAKQKQPFQAVLGRLRQTLGSACSKRR